MLLNTFNGKGQIMSVTGGIIVDLVGLIVGLMIIGWLIRVIWLERKAPEKLDKKRTHRILWWSLVAICTVAALSYTIGYPATTRNFAFGVIWPLLTVFWAIQCRQIAERHGEW